MAEVGPAELKQYIGPYRILGPIGAGASATVYRGLDEASGAEVAVKVLADNHSLVPEVRQRFLDEISLLMSIRSPMVAQVLGQGETDTGQPYIVLELADRGSLGRRMETLREAGGSPNRQDLFDLADHLAGALAALHRVGIVHRDVAPGNILISGAESLAGPDHLAPLPSVTAANLLRADERYLLADLGFAKDLQRASGLTAGGGTRGFAAPEQRDEVTVVDHRADVFGATSAIEWLAEGTGLTDDLRPFFDIGLAPDPEDRYQSMEDWHRGFRRTLDRRPASFAGPGSSAAGSRVAGGSARGKPRAAGRVALKTVGAVVLGLAALAAVVWFTTRSDPSTDALLSESVGAPTTTGSPDTPDSEASNTDQTNTDLSATTTTSAATLQTGPQQSSTTTTSQGTTTGVQTTTNQPATTEQPTMSLVTTTTVDPRFEFSPRAFIDGPAAGATVSGDLRISGTARYRDGITGVAVIVRRLADDFVWDPGAEQFKSEWEQFTVPVSPDGGDDVTWSTTVDERFLEPGRYLIRVWARGTNANDPLSDRREIVIAG